MEKGVEAMGAGPGRWISGARAPHWKKSWKKSWKKPQWPTRRRLFVGLGVAGAAVLAVGLAVMWLAVRGLDARSRLLAARADLAAVQADLAAGPGTAGPGTAGPGSVGLGGGSALSGRVTAIIRAAASARASTHDPVWATAAAVPVLGCPARAARGLTSAFDDLARTGLPGVATFGESLDPKAVRQGTGLRLAAFRQAAGPVADAQAALDRFATRLAEVPTCGRLGRAAGLAGAKTQAQVAVAQIRPTIEKMSLVTRLVPAMLGGTGGPGAGGGNGDGDGRAGGAVRHYLLIVQNPAESRANGGVLGGFGVLTVRNGQLTLGEISGNDKVPTLPDGGASLPPLPSNLAALYGEFTPDRLWVNANLTPDYPTAARFYTDMYTAGTGQPIDGTVSLDPETLSYLLAATRPAVLPDGTVITAQNLVPLVASRIYAQIRDGHQRDSFIAEVGRATYQAVASGAGSGRSLLTALQRAVRERRLEISSTHPAEETLLAPTAVGGALPSAPGAYLGVVTQNADGGKLDYWLRRSTDYRAIRQRDGSAMVTLTVDVSNTAPAGLPAYVRLRGDAGAPPGNPDAENLVWLSVYTGRGSGVLGATVDGTPVTMTTGTERDHPVVATKLAIPRGTTRRVVLRIWEPIASALVVRPQPLIAPERLTVAGLPVAGRSSAR